MATSNEAVVAALKEIIDRNGPDYISAEPYEAYKALMAAGTVDKKTANGLLYLWMSGVITDSVAAGDTEQLSQTIKKECSLNKGMADHLANIMGALYSSDHKEEWKSKEGEGLRQFLAEDFEVAWNGFAVWDAGSGTVDCRYEAEIAMVPDDTVHDDGALKKQLKKNPFMTKEEIHGFFAKRLKEYLDSAFEDYCTCEDYYQPVVEDFEIDYYVEKWGKDNGFDLISCEGSGEDQGFEPKFRRWR